MFRTVAVAMVGVGALLGGCGSDGDGEGPGAGGAGPATSSSTTTTTDGSGGTGGGTCGEPYDRACNCTTCDAIGGECRSPCNFGVQWVCYEPGPLGEGQFSCDGVVNCNADQACVQIEPDGDGCRERVCSDLPSVCVDDPTCACLAPFIDEAQLPTSCDDSSGHPEVSYRGYEINEPPWDQPWCGDLTCVGEETCWACTIDGDVEPSSFQCEIVNPSASGIQYCTRQWPN